MGVVLYLILSIKAINLTRRQSNFIDSVTHELKSPIASMKLYLQTLNRHQVSQQLQADFHRFMLEDLERLDHLINQMLDAGRLEAERPDGEDEDVELAELLKDCAAAVCMNYRVLRRHGASRLAADALSRPADRPGHHLSQSDRQRGEIRRHAAAGRGAACGRRPTGTIVVRIADNGRGIPHHLRRKIFGRFVRLGLELEREKPGTGLGLYIARTLVRRQQGPDPRPRSRDRRRQRVRSATAREG